MRRGALRNWICVVAVFATAVAIACAGSAGARAAGNPEPQWLRSLIGQLYVSPGVSPPGANNWSCEPTAAHPYPVVLVHGTLFDQTMTWNLMAPVLERAGYCVFALDYGHRATQPIAGSARELAAFVTRVLRATRARRVDLVGHSQGGMMPRYYLEFLGGTRYVHDLVGLAPSNHGTTLIAAGPVGEYADCPACSQQVVGSAFLKKLNAGDQTPGPVNYTVIETDHDEVVTPYQSAFLPTGPRVTNVLLQDDCPADPSEHVTITDDPVAIEWVLNALGQVNRPADPAFNPDCTGLSLLNAP